MTTKEYLSQGLLLRRLIAAKQSRLADLRDMLTACTRPTDAVAVQSSARDKMADTVAKLVDAEVEAADDIARLLAVQREIGQVIGRVQNPVYRLVLEERYINCKTFEKIAVDNAYSYYHVVHRLHPRALAAVKEV